MNDIIPIDRVGRMVLPKFVRDHFRLTGESKLRAEIVGDHLELRLVETASPPLAEKGGLLVVESKGSRFDAVQAMEEERNGREDHLRGSFFQRW